jgi:hypothetical protein
MIVRKIPDLDHIRGMNGDLQQQAALLGKQRKGNIQHEQQRLHTVGNIGPHPIHT